STDTYCCSAAISCWRAVSRSVRVSDNGSTLHWDFWGNTEAPGGTGTACQYTRSGACRCLPPSPVQPYSRAESSKVIAKATTESRVSIADQVFRVWPTVIPKYSFTSQNPASLTWDRNSDPAPIASATRAPCTGSSSTTRGATMPAAEMVATVAEPVATRMPTAMSQPR